mgnify:CR=1 FL=1
MGFLGYYMVLSLHLSRIASLFLSLTLCSKSFYLLRGIRTKMLVPFHIVLRLGQILIPFHRSVCQTLLGFSSNLISAFVFELEDSYPSNEVNGILGFIPDVTSPEIKPE